MASHVTLITRRLIESKLEDEQSLRAESASAHQSLDDLKQECSLYDNQARTLEMDIKQTETLLRCALRPSTLLYSVTTLIRIVAEPHVRPSSVLYFNFC